MTPARPLTPARRRVPPGLVRAGVGGLTGGTLALTALVGCARTETTRRPVGASSAATVEAAPAVQRWEVIEAGARLGSVVRFEDEGRFLYVVRNREGQDLGLVDALGRAWRRRPHGPDERLGTGTLVEGVRRILSAAPGATLEPAPPPREGP